MDQVSIEPSVHSTPKLCIVDLTAPTFDGIKTLIANLNGSLKATWDEATDPDSPVITYLVYIQPSSESVSNLFTEENLQHAGSNLSAIIYDYNNEELLRDGVEYRVGVRSMDESGNVDSNTFTLNAISSGVLSQSVGQLASLVAASLRNQQAMQATVESTELEVNIESITIDSEISDKVEFGC